MASYENRALLLLGVLETQESHGYQLVEFIERTLYRVTDMKKATAYATLDRLEREGLVESTEERVGNRPPRKVFKVTPLGSKRLRDFVTASLGKLDDLRGEHDAAVMFLDALDPKEALARLEQRLEARRRELADYDHAPAHLGLGVNLAIDHVKTLVRADIDWLERAIKSLRAEAKKKRRAG